jgi:hypothetical protein
MNELVISTEKISKKREQRQRLIEAMLHEPSLEKAAAAAGISPTTAWRIRQTPAFQTEYMQARRELHQHSMARLQSATGPAVTMLLKMMIAADSSPVIRLRVIEFVLRLGNDAMELQDFATRLERLEERDKKWEAVDKKKAA